MVESATILPVRRSELHVAPIGNDGRCIVKDRRTGEYFQLGPEEAFLFDRLDGRETKDAVCRSFSERFGEELPPEDLDEFVSLARGRRLLEPEPDETASSTIVASHPSDVPAGRQPARSASAQSLLFWRHRLFDPDRLMSWLEPMLRFAWTRHFLIASAAAIAVACVIAWSSRGALVSHFADALRWETLLLAWLTLFAVTMAHEFAHGLTCKHFGGEVREIGFILIFLMPALYCNVSDAWLFREKSKRLWVTFAGGYLDLVLWSLAVLAWRVLQPGTLANHLAWVVLTVISARVFFNLNPLLKLDGYYLLSDLLEMPNLRERAIGRLQAWGRYWLWGANRPEPASRGGLLFWLGLAMWLFSLVFLGLMLVGLGSWATTRFGAAGFAVTAALGFATIPTMFRGFAAGEVRAMFRSRPIRLCMWGALAVGAPSALLPLEVLDRYGGEVELRPLKRVEIRATAAGFLQDVRPREGHRISRGELIAVLDVPDLATRLARTDAEIREAEAQLRRLEVGQRPEELEELRHRADRAQTWRESARTGLDRAERMRDEDLVWLTQAVSERQAELDRTAAELRRSGELLSRKAATMSEHQRLEAAHRVALAQWEQAESARRSREAAGVHSAKEELSRRETELSEAEAALSLALAGTRPEEIAAAQARIESLRAERNYLYELRRRLDVSSPIEGLVTTPRTQERIGQYLREGDPICEVVETARLRAEIHINEQVAARIQPGQRVDVKIRALPDKTFAARVLRIAPVAEVPSEGPTQPYVRVECEIDNSDLLLRPAMTGYARIYGQRKPLGELALDRISRFVRTEFWW